MTYRLIYRYHHSPTATNIDELLQPRFLFKPENHKSFQTPTNSSPKKICPQRREDLTSPSAKIHRLQPSSCDHDYSHPTAVETHNIANIDEICPEKRTGYCDWRFTSNITRITLEEEEHHPMIRGYKIKQVLHNQGGGIPKWNGLRRWYSVTWSWYSIARSSITSTIKPKVCWRDAETTISCSSSEPTTTSISETTFLTRTRWASSKATSKFRSRWTSSKTRYWFRTKVHVSIHILGAVHAVSIFQIVYWISMSINDISVGIGVAPKPAVPVRGPLDEQIAIGEFCQFEKSVFGFLAPGTRVFSGLLDARW